MSKKRKRPLNLFVFIVIVLAVLALWPGEREEEPLEPAVSGVSYDFSAKDALSVSFIDVGQGDAILLAHDDDYVLIDGGSRDATDTVLAYCEAVGVDRFDLVIATHPHEDHIGGLDEALATYGADKVWLHDTDYDSLAWEELQTAVSEYADDSCQPMVGENWTLDGVSIMVLAPVGDLPEDTNEGSIVVRVEHAGNSFLLTGDATKATERDVMALGYNIESDILKLGHHGSSYSSSEIFLEAVNPEIAIISCGEDNMYGHPHKETLEALNAQDITAYRTDLNGTIVIESSVDGELTTYTEK